LTGFSSTYHSKKERIHFQRPFLPFFPGNPGRDLKERGPHPALPAAGQPLHRDDQQRGEGVRRFRPCRHGAGDESPVRGRPGGLRLFEGVPAGGRIQLWGGAARPPAGGRPDRCPLVHRVLCALRTDSGPFCPPDHVPLYPGGRRDGTHRHCRFAGRRPVFFPLRVLYGVLLPVPRHGKGRGGVHFGRLPTGALLCAGDPDSPSPPGAQRGPLRTAGSGCPLRRCRSADGSPAPQGAGGERSLRPAQGGVTTVDPEGPVSGLSCDL